jgi:hypothetical protein
MDEIVVVELFRRAWELAWRNKMLWLYGFVAALSGDLLSTIRIGPELSLDPGSPLLQGHVFDISGWARAVRLLGGSLVVAALLTLTATMVLWAVVLCAKAGLVRATQLLSRQDAFDNASVLNGIAGFLPSLIGATLLLYVPFWLASDIAGELLRLSPGLLRLPLYLVLLVLLVVGAVLPFWQILALCGIVLDGLRPREAIARARRLAERLPTEMLVMVGALVVLGLVLNGLARLVLQPVADVSLLSVLLTAFRGDLAFFGQVLGLLVLGAVATAIMTPMQVLAIATLTLTYRSAYRPTATKR